MHIILKSSAKSVKIISQVLGVTFVLHVLLIFSTGSLLWGQSPGAKDEILELLINDSVNYQEIEHFGASDAWSIQFVGKWPSAKREAIADLLFSKELDDQGNPRGIGLSLWRFNVGAGSVEQGRSSRIRDEWRRAESFLSPDGTYDWDKQEGQVWFANAAKERGVEKLLLFSNSPPVHITRNGKAYATNGETNLSSEKFEEYAAYFAEVVEGLGDKGLDVDYLSPVNEPQWDWSDGGQEGTPFRNEEIARLVKAIDQEFLDRDISVSIDIPEAAQINYLYEKGNKPKRGDQIQAFFSENSPNYVGDLTQVGNAVSGHSYFTTSPFSQMVRQREKLAEAIDEVPGLRFWMSEYCILGGNDGEINGNGRDLGIDSALYMARVIHSDLAIAQASAWHWWLAVSPYDYKDGLVYIDREKEDGEFYESKMLWALGNYSRFIRPRFQRIKISGTNNHDRDENFLFSAFKNPGKQEVVVVIVNSGDKDKAVHLNSNSGKDHEIKTYTTSSEKDLEYEDVMNEGIISVPKRSIVTVVVQNL